MNLEIASDNSTNPKTSRTSNRGGLESILSYDILRVDLFRVNARHAVARERYPLLGWVRLFASS